jgi:hypothetical protein
MTTRPKTVQECCEMLGVSPNSSREEIQLAFVLRRREVATSGEFTDAQMRAAYEMLVDPNRRAGAVREAVQRPAPTRQRQSEHKSVNTVTLLGVLLCVLVAILAFSVWPAYGYRFRSFEPQDRLLNANTRKPYGVVLEASNAYTFSNGKVGRAYRVRLESDGSEVWYPASDVQYVCVRQ